MNERIRELAEQANTNVFIQSDGRLTPGMEKFAELIIRECARVDSEENNPDHVDGETYNQTILQHFGVEQ